MFDLPLEVLHLLFPLLVQRDLLECMTVCRQWQDIIGRDFLFRVILVHNVKQLDNLIKRIKRDPILGTRVERIQIKLAEKTDHNFDSRILVDIFPNLRNLYIQNSDGLDSNNIPVEQLHGHPWCKRIEKMVAKQTNPNVGTVLLSGLCPNLTYIETYGNEGSARRLIESLSHAPALKTLNMSHYEMSFNDIERLHEVVPCLGSFLMENIVFRQDSIPSDITPATSMRSLTFSDCFFGFFEVFNPHLLYFSQKYIQLEELKLELDLFNLSNNTFRLQPEQRSMLVSCFKTLAPHLKMLSLSTYIRSVVRFAYIDFNILDESGCQFKKIKFESLVELNKLELFSQTALAQHIESLTAFVMVRRDYNSTSFEWLTRFKMLKELTLQFPFAFRRIDHDIVIDLADILDCLSETRLETLRLHDLKLHIGDINRNTAHTSLKTLMLSDVPFDKGADAFISRTFPNLKILKMSKCFKETDSFILPHTNLSYLEIINRSAHEDFPILLITLCDGQRRLYNTTTTAGYSPYFYEDWNTDIFTLPYIYSKPSDVADKIPVVTVVCNSVYDFVLNGAVANSGYF